MALLHPVQLVDQRRVRRTRLIVAGGVALVGVVALLAWQGAAGRVEGATPAERIASIEKLSDTGRSAAADAIAAAVGDPMPEVRRAAVAALGRFHRPGDRPLIDAALSDAEAGIRTAAVGTLSCYAPPPVERLAQVLAEDKAEVVRAAAAAALGRLKDAGALAALATSAERDKSPLVREEAFKSVLAILGIGYARPADINDPARGPRLMARIRQHPKFPRNGGGP